MNLSNSSIDDNFTFDPLDPATRRDPYPLFARARRRHPLYAHPGLPLVSIFRYADVDAVLRDADGWSSDFARFVQPYLLRNPELAAEMPPFFAASDGADHRRQRTLVNKAFTARMVRALQPAMRRTVDELLDAALERREIDLITALTSPFPVRVIARLLGVPDSDSQRFQTWSRQLINSQMQGLLRVPEADQVARQIDATRAMHSYFAALIDARRRDPGEDLLSALISVHGDGALSYPELLQMLTVLIVAGNATTTALIGNMVAELLAHPDQLERLRSDSGLVPSAVDEVLRFASPVQAMPRMARRATELHGVPIAAGQFALLWIGSANRDESAFARPDELDVGRDPNPHLAFGIGPHACIGAALARLEGCVVMNALLERTRAFERIDRAPLPLHSSFVARSYTELPVRLIPA